MYALPKIRYIPIGKILEWNKSTKKFFPTGKNLYFKDYGFGVHCIIAVARFGKSVLTKNIYTQASKYRPLVIFDYGTEHRDSRFPNFFSNGKIRGISDLKIYKNIGFRISDFANFSDWVSAGFPVVAAGLMPILVKNKGAHQDDPERFLEILLKLPILDWEVQKFNDEFGYDLPAKIHIATKDSMVTRFNIIKEKNIFTTNGLDSLDYYDFGQELFKHEHILISLGINIELDLWKAHVMVGKILEQLYGRDGKNFSRYQRRWGYAPMLILEEADKLAPEWRTNEPPPSSLSWLIDYVIKFQKYGPALIFIAQDPNLLNSTIHGNALSNIYGQLPETSRTDLKLITSRLKWDIDSNYREFVYMTKDKRVTRFLPDNPPCIG